MNRMCPRCRKIAGGLSRFAPAGSDRPLRFLDACAADGRRGVLPSNE
jgi:hypothetical protein